MFSALVYFLAIHGVISRESDGFNVNLNQLGLTRVPANITSMAKTLDLSANLLTTVRNASFVKLRNLTHLDLSFNRIDKLEALAFSGLRQLNSLKLNYNRLTLTYDAYPDTVFYSLPNLEYLDLSSNQKANGIHVIKEYPTKIFANSRNMIALSIDSLDGVDFDSGFLCMPRLKSLKIVCTSMKLERISVFLQLRIESLLLFCNSIQLGTIKPFKHLTSLSLWTSSLSQSLSLLSDIRGRNLTSLEINNSNRGNSVRAGINHESLYLTRNNTEHLSTICVKHLSLRHNYILHIEESVFLLFKHPECIETLDMSQNMLVATHVLIFLELARFNNLKYVDISEEAVSFRRKREALPDTSENKGLFKFREKRHLTLWLPSSIVLINASHIGGHNPNLPNLQFHNSQYLRTLDLAYFGIQDCRFHVVGLENVTALNISGFDCRGSSPRLLESFPSLETLVARQCRMEESLQHDALHIAFRNLLHLRTLDLSSNGLTSLHGDHFKPLRNLRSLILLDNKLSQVPVTVWSLPTLSLIDLSLNVFVALSKEGIRYLERMPSHRQQELVISMYNNPLLCTCHTTPFLQWFFSTAIRVDEHKSLYCTLKNGTVTKVGDLKYQIKNMSIECVSKFWLTLSIAGSCLFTLAVILAIFGYRYRWNIKYWVLTKCRRGRPNYEALQLEAYQYDAFVAYNYQNYQWACIVLRNFLETEHNYSLCLHDRDFPVGVSIQQNIVDAVNNSRKVILVINRAFLTSDWCEFEIQMAGMRMIRDGREDAIIVIMTEEIPVGEMPRSLLNLWKHITFLLWDNNPLDEGAFWGRLLEVMARP